jgi:hypothetical protein
MAKSSTKPFKVQKDGIGLNLFSDFKYLFVYCFTKNYICPRVEIRIAIAIKDNIEISMMQVLHYKVKNKSNKSI